MKNKKIRKKSKKPSLGYIFFFFKNNFQNLIILNDLISKCEVVLEYSFNNIKK